MRQLWIWICIAGLMLACGPSRQQLQQAEFYTKLGISNLIAGSCTEALRYLLEAERRGGNSSEMHNALGLAYFCKDEYEYAAEAYRKAIRLRPDFSEAHNNLGAAYVALGQYDNAIASFERALADLLYDTKERAWLNMGDAYAARLDSENALRAYRKAVEVAMPKPAARDVVCVAYHRMGTVHMRDRQYQEALNASGRAIRLCPKYHEPHAQLANAYLRTGNRNEAIRSCETVISLAPESDEARACARTLEFLRGGRR